MDHMHIINDVIGQNTIAYWSCMGLACGRWDPLLVISPVIARAFSNDGWTKDDIRNYLYENVKLPAHKLETYAQHVGLSDFTLKGHVTKGLLPAEYAESDDPERLVRCNLKAEWIGILIAGDPGRNQSKCYVTNHYHGAPVSRRILGKGKA